MCELLSVLCSPDMNAVEQLEMKQVGARVGGLSVEGERYGREGHKGEEGREEGGIWRGTNEFVHSVGCMREMSLRQFVPINTLHYSHSHRTYYACTYYMVAS